MLLQIKNSHNLVKIVDIEELINPNIEIVHGHNQQGQEEQDIDDFEKDTLVFPSGESLPRCWLDANYRKHELS